MVKSRGHFRGGFDEFFKPEQIYEVDCPGLTSPVLANFTWTKLPRPGLSARRRDDLDAPPSVASKGARHAASFAARPFGLSRWQGRRSAQQPKTLQGRACIRI